MEICPHHHTEPSVRAFVAREGVDETYTDKDGRNGRYVLPKLVVYRVFCPACAKSGVSARLGKGYSASSREAAVKRWNSACMNEKLKMFKNAVKTGC